MLSICIGVGLSAACGFRIFMPLFIMSLASLSGHLGLSPGFEWIGTPTALAAFGAATFIEISAYYVPWVDNLLDTIALPAATIAGTIAMASSVSDMSPFLQWTLAVIAGGGIAGTVQAITGLTRAASTLTTGGLGNPVLSTIEAVGAVAVSVLAITLPVITVIAVFGIIYFALKKVLRKSSKRKHFATRHESKQASSPVYPAG